MTVQLGYRFPDRQRLSTREPFTWRAEYRLRPIDFTNAVITFRMVNSDTREIKLDAGLGAGDGEGVLAYYPVEWDVDVAGLYECQFMATYNAAVIYRSPIIHQRIARNPEDMQPPPYPPPHYYYPSAPLNPYLTPPRAPTAFDDEFRSGNPTLERRGWNVYATATGQPMTRLGDVTVAAPNLVGNVYNSSIVDGVLRIQSTIGMHIVKPVIGAPMQIVAHLGDPRVSDDHCCFLQACSYPGALTNTALRVFTGYQWGKQTFSAMYENQYYYQHRVAVPPADSSAYVFMLELQRSFEPDVYSWRNAVIEPLTGRIIWIDDTPLAINAFDPIQAGLEVITANKPYSWVEIGMVRAYPAGSWFPT